MRTCEIDSLDAGNFTAWHIDPDRRPAGNRTTAYRMEQPQPRLSSNDCLPIHHMPP